MSAVFEIAQKFDKRERASMLSIAAMGARGEWDGVKKMIKEWSQ